jgi:hypothetical protein
LRLSINFLTNLRHARFLSGEENWVSAQPETQPVRSSSPEQGMVLIEVKSIGLNNADIFAIMGLYSAPSFLDLNSVVTCSLMDFQLQRYKCSTCRPSEVLRRLVRYSV